MSDINNTVGTTDIAQMLGVTERRVDYWLRIKAAWITDDARGSGSRRSYTPAEVAGFAAIAEARDLIRQIEEAVLDGTVFREGMARYEQEHP